VKTAISVPDDTFTRAEQRARTLGITRSQFYTQAAQRYLEQLDAESLTRQIDAAIEMIGAEESNRLASAAGRHVLEQADEDYW
jgi:metal-responsive CopG/Arc/MetJ family transcriptional regulator